MTKKTQKSADQGQKGAEVTPIMGRKCPLCGKPASKDHRPFCSKRCADLDLGQWLGEGYRIPTEDEPDLDQLPADPEL